MSFLPQGHWKYIKGYDLRYKINRNGIVISCERKVWNGRIWWIQKEKELKKNLSTRGYYQINLTKKCKTTICQLHRLLAQAFIPNPENKPFINHKNGNKLNNSLNNLEWCTASENIRHAFNTGLKKGVQRYGIKNYQAKITEKEVKKIRALTKLELLKTTAKRFNLSIAQICSIQTRKSWSHIQ